MTANEPTQTVPGSDGSAGHESGPSDAQALLLALENVMTTSTKPADIDLTFVRAVVDNMNESGWHISNTPDWNWP